MKSMENVNGRMVFNYWRTASGSWTHRLAGGMTWPGRRMCLDDLEKRLSQM